MVLKIAQIAALFAATLTTGMMAGLFASYSYSVMPGLHATGDRTFVEAMQRINVAILNGWFFVCFLGALVFTAVAAALHVPPSGRAALPWILAALVLYVAVLVVTGAVNVPLNNALNAAGDPDRITDPAAVRAAFESRWVTWNVVRTAGSTLAFAALIWALVARGR